MAALVVYNVVMSYACPPPYAYLNDFVYLDWNDKTSKDHIVAYAKEPNYLEPDGICDVAYASVQTSGLPITDPWVAVSKQVERFDDDP